MSEEQAIETEATETEIVEEVDGVEASAETEEVEIVVEGEGEPSSKPHQNGFQKRIGRLNRKVNAANTEADEERRRREMVEEENKLLRLQAQQSKPSARPDEDDFDTHAEYMTALDEFDNARISAIAEKKAAEIVQASQTQTTQLKTEGNLNQQIDAHYERSAELKVSDYEETETIAADILGDDIAKQIVAKTDKSHLLMYHLGKNPAKAEAIKSMIDADPLKGVMEIGRLAGSLSVKPKTSAPDPETTLNGGLKPDDKRGPKGATFT